MKTVLVTGAAGFIGSHLCERLVSDGWSVVGLDNFCDFYDPAIKRRNTQELCSNQLFHLVEVDIRDREKVANLFQQRRPSVVVHIAAMAGVRPSIERPALYTAVNVDGTVNLLEAAGQHGVERFVFASSSSVYGNNKKVPFSEDDPVDHPISPYAATKKAGELLCHCFSHLYGFRSVVLRFFTVFGPRQRPDLAIQKFLERIARGDDIPMFGDGTSSRDYTYIDDIINGIVAAMEVDVRYRIYNLGGSHPVTLNELVATVERVTGLRARLRRLALQPGDVEHTYADIERSRRELGFEPTVGLEAGIARQWSWYRKVAGL